MSAATSEIKHARLDTGVTDPDGGLKLTMPEPEPEPSGLDEFGVGVVKVLACFWNLPELSRVKLACLLLLN